MDSGANNNLLHKDAAKRWQITTLPLAQSLHILKVDRTPSWSGIITEYAFLTFYL